MEGSFGIELRGLWSDMVVRALGCCQSLRIEVAENPGGLNGSMQHYLIWGWIRVGQSQELHGRHQGERLLLRFAESLAARLQ